MTRRGESAPRCDSYLNTPSCALFGECLGHHDPGSTLRTYTRLMPSSGTRTRAAEDRVFVDGEPTIDGPDTPQEGIQPSDQRLSQ